MYAKPSFGPEETETDQMQKTLNTRNKVQKQREELKKQIEENRKTRDMQKQNRLEEETYEGEMNQATMKAQKMESERIHKQHKDFVKDALT